MKLPSIVRLILRVSLLGAATALAPASTDPTALRAMAPLTPPPRPIPAAQQLLVRASPLLPPKKLDRTGRSPGSRDAEPPLGLRLSSASLDWGTLYLSPTLPRCLRLLAVTNDGPVPVSVSLGPVTGPGAAAWKLAMKIALPMTLLPQQQCLYAWSAQPSRAGTLSGEATLLAGTNTVGVPLTATAAVPTGERPRSWATQPGAGPATAPPGPRGPVGPAVPLSPAETGAFARRVTVTGRTAAAIQAACKQAVKQGIPVVFLPAGTYRMDTMVRVPGGLTLLGEGSQTVCKAADDWTEMFFADGDQIRFTRMKLLGATTAWTDGSQPVYNNSRGIEDWGKQNIRIDHCELLGFCYATLFMLQATGEVDHCFIRHNRVIGLGYGVSVVSGSYVLVTDNEFSDCRHMLASNGDTRNQGIRPPHWEFRHNHVFTTDPSPNLRGAVDTHPKFEGTFVVEGNFFEDQETAVGIYGGSGLIRGNRFRNVGDAVKISNNSDNGYIGIPHDINIEGNDFAGMITRRYGITSKTVSIFLDGQPLPTTAQRPVGPPR